MDVHRLARVSNYKGSTIRHPEDPKNARLRGVHPSDISSSPKIYQVVNRNSKTFNEFRKMCEKKKKPIPSHFTKVKVLSFKVILHRLWD